MSRLIGVGGAYANMHLFNPRELHFTDVNIVSPGSCKLEADQDILTIGIILLTSILMLHMEILVAQFY